MCWNECGCVDCDIVRYKKKKKTCSNEYYDDCFIMNP